MKYYKGIIMAIICSCVLSACAEGKTPQVSSNEILDSVSQESPKKYEDNTDMNSSENVVTETKASAKSDYFNWQNIKFYLPEWLSRENMYGYDVFSGSLSTNDKIYYHFVTDGYYDALRTNYIENYTHKDVPDIIGDSLNKVVYEFYPYFDDKYAVSIDSEEEVESNGFPFIKRTGVIHAEKYADTGEVADLQYIAYYGCMDMDMFDGRSVPMMWAAFAEVTDDKTLEDMEMLVDTAAQNAEWFEN